MCENEQASTELLEAAVWKDVCLLLHDPQRVREEFERRLNREAPLALAVGQLEVICKKCVGRLRD